jgi:tetratricopeptide (TPR) repeat protein
MKTLGFALSVTVFAGLMSGTVIGQHTLVAKPIERHLGVKHVISARSSHKIEKHTASSANVRTAYLPPATDQESFRRLDTGVSLDKQGDADAVRADWQAAAIQYQSSLKIWPGNQQALYGLGRCAEADGNTDDAIRYYRSAIYTHPDPPMLPTIREGNVDKLMEYVLLLSQAGHEDEALAIYHRASGLLNYDQGQPNVDVLLPDFASGEANYTPQRLQAMAHVAIAVVYFAAGDNRAEQELKQAIQLAPESAIPHFYLGKILYAHNDIGAKAEYEKAIDLDGGQVGAAAKERIKLCR